MSIARRIAAVIGAIAVAATGLTFVAAPASADEVWHQAYQRASADAPCTAPTDQTPWQGSFTGQQAWTPSWAKWPNNNTGGWVCERTIIWARNGRPSAFCVPAAPKQWSNFQGGWSLPFGNTGFGDPDCTATIGDSHWQLVYAPPGWDPAQLCMEAFGTAEDLRDWGFYVYGCKGLFG